MLTFADVFESWKASYHTACQVEVLQREPEQSWIETKPTHVYYMEMTAQCIAHMSIVAMDIKTNTQFHYYLVYCKVK